MIIHWLRRAEPTLAPVPWLPPAEPPDDGPACSLPLRRRGPRQASGFARRGGPSSHCAPLAALLALLPFAHASEARAAESEPVRVEYHADEGCPDADAFLRAVLQRTSRARAAREREHEPARTFHVVISRDAHERVHGAFSVTDARDAEQTSSARSVDSSSCAEVFDALTLFAALSVDVDLREAEPAPSTTPGSEHRAAPTSPPAAPPPAPHTQQSDRAPRRLLWLAGVDAGWLSAGTTERPLTVEPFLETRWQRAVRTGIDVSPTLRVALSVFSGNSDRNDAGYAHLQWTAARLDACPLSLVYAEKFRLRPCLSFSGGVLNASGRDIAQPASHHLAWWTLGGALRVEWMPNAFGFELTAGFEAPLQRAQLYFEPSSEVYRPPVVFERVTLGAAYHFL